MRRQHYERSKARMPSLHQWMSINGCINGSILWMLLTCRAHPVAGSMLGPQLNRLGSVPHLTCLSLQLRNSPSDVKCCYVQVWDPLSGGPHAWAFQRTAAHSPLPEFMNMTRKHRLEITLWSLAGYCEVLLVLSCRGAQVWDPPSGWPHAWAAERAAGGGGGAVRRGV